MLAMNLEQEHQKDRNYSSLEVPILILRLSDRIKGADSKGISPSQENSMVFAELMISNLKRLHVALQKERNSKSIYLIQEELKNISSFLDDKNLKIRSSKVLENIASKKLKHFLKEFKSSQFIEVMVSSEDKIEDGWYAFRNDSDNVEGFYSTCINGRINLINKDGKSTYVGLGQVSVK